METNPGAVTVTATDNRLAELRTTSATNEIFIHYSAAKRLAENFQWRCVKLDFTPGLVPVVGVETVIPLASSLLAKERACLPPDERCCFFCAEAVALDDEYFAWHHRAGGAQRPPNVHLVVIAYACRKASCKKETDAWVTAVRKKPVNQKLQYWCSQCFRIAEEGTKFLACGRCLAVNYCSEECQRKHWAAHRAFCQNVPQ